MRSYAFGIDIGGTTIKIGFFRTDGCVQDTWQIPTRKEENGKYILEDIACEIKEKIANEKIMLSEVEGIGLGVPGPVSENGTVFKCVNLGWGIINVEEKLGALTGLKVKAGNDANVAALGEMWQGGGKGHKNVVMVTLGTGVGGGIVINGKIVSGIHGAGGEIGHIKMSDEENEICGCGKKGCLEQYTSATGIVKMTHRYMQKNKLAQSVLKSENELTAKSIFDAAKAGDKVALTMVDEFGKLLGKALSYISCVCDPEIFVIGGGVSNAGTIILDVVKKYYKEYAFHASRETEFSLAELGNEAGIIGSVKMVL